MRFKDLLNEKWYKTVKGGLEKSGIIEIFENPTKHEIQEISKNGYGSVRLGFDNKLNLYAWDGIKEIHRFMFKKYLKKPIYFGFTYSKYDKYLTSHFDTEWESFNKTKQDKIKKKIKKLFPTLKIKIGNPSVRAGEEIILEL